METKSVYEALLPLFVAGAVCSAYYAITASVLQIAASKTTKEVSCVICMLISSIVFTVVCSHYGIKLPIAVFVIGLFCAESVQQVGGKKGGARYDN